MRKTQTVVLLGIATILTWIMVQACGSQKTVKNSAASASDSPWLNTGDSAQHVGMGTCRSCHVGHYEDFSHTGMGMSFQPATALYTEANFKQVKPIYDKFLDLYYLPLMIRDSIYIKEYRLQGRDTTHTRLEKIDYIVGSGHHTNSHIINRGGYLHQAPLTFYVQQGKWDLPPGFEGGFNSRFDRSLGAECLTCHNGYPKYEAKSLNKFYSVPLGIDCERCHGPGSIHAREKLAGHLVDTHLMADYTIVNPKKLPYSLQIDVCQRCHLQGNAILKPGKTWFDFKPGMQLSSVMDVYMPNYQSATNGEPFIMASHAQRLGQSQCFIKSQNASGDPSLTCITCHNPHQSVKTTGRQKIITTCQGCHPQEHTDKPSYALASNKENCISCHMPKSGAVDIPHITITDHKVAVHKTKGKSTNTVSNDLQFKGLQLLNRSNTANLAERAQAFMNYYEKFERKPFMLDSAKKYLSTLPLSDNSSLWLQYYFLKEDFKAATALSAQVSDKWSAMHYYMLGQSWVNLGKVAEGLAHLKKAQDLMPFQLDYISKYGLALLATGKMDEAMAAFKKAQKENAKHLLSAYGLGLCQAQQGDLKLATSTLERALGLDPNHLDTLIALAQIAYQQGDRATAEAYARRAVKQHPKSGVAQSLLQTIIS